MKQKKVYLSEFHRMMARSNADSFTLIDTKVIDIISCYTCGSKSCTEDWWRYPEQRQRQYGEQCFVYNIEFFIP
jgi:hypothetical protein